MGRTVWVLGAGFSRPLGGPLLGELLTPETQANLVASYQGQYPKLNDRFTRAALQLYNFGLQFKNGVVGGALSLYGDRGGSRLWADAEEFLDYLDVAAQHPSSRPGRRLQPYLETLHHDNTSEPPLTLPQVSAAARRLVAAECCAFTEGADLNLEKYAPHVRWMRELVQRDDAILSFNYDFVVEQLARFVPGKLNVLRLDQKPDSSAAWLYKLHGSINWRKESEQAITFTKNEHFALECSDAELAIASPGPTKQNVTKQLEAVWLHACNAIASRNTDRIVFIGYRFPPSDANAKQRLLSAIMGSGAPYLAVHVVLGPNKAASDVVRLEAMLRYALTYRAEHSGDQDPPLNDRRFNLVVQPLFAEDFFTVMNEDILTKPWVKAKPINQR